MLTIGEGKISVTGVASVETFTDRAIVLLINGRRLKIDGAKFRVLSFSEGSGAFSAAGEVSNVRFGAGAKGIAAIFR